MPPIDGPLVQWIGAAFIDRFECHHFLRTFDFLISYDPRDIPELLKFLSVAVFVYYRKAILSYNLERLFKFLLSKAKDSTDVVNNRDIEGIIRLVCQYMDDIRQ